MSEKKKCPNCPVASPVAARDRLDIEWLVEQRVQRTLAARQSYSNGLSDGVIYTVLVCLLIAYIFWPEVKKVVA